MGALRTEAAAFLEQVTDRELLAIRPAIIDQARQIAHQLYRAGRLLEADVVCRGLIACDHRCAWTYSLHAAVLRRGGHLQQAVAQVQRGLAYEPGHVKLRAMQAELMAAVAGPSSLRAEGSPLLRATDSDHRSRTQRPGPSTDSDP